MKVNLDIIDQEKKKIKEHLDKYLKSIFKMSISNLPENCFAVMNEWCLLDDNMSLSHVNNKYSCSIIMDFKDITTVFYNYYIDKNSLLINKKYSLPFLYNNDYISLFSDHDSYLGIFTVACNDFKLDVLDKMKHKFYYIPSRNKMVFNFKSYKKIYFYDGQ